MLTRRKTQLARAKILHLPYKQPSSFTVIGHLLIMHLILIENPPNVFGLLYSLFETVQRVRSYEDTIALPEAELTAVQQYEASVL